MKELTLKEQLMVCKRDSQKEISKKLDIMCIGFIGLKLKWKDEQDCGDSFKTKFYPLYYSRLLDWYTTGYPEPARILYNLFTDDLNELIKVILKISAGRDCEPIRWEEFLDWFPLHIRACLALYQDQTICGRDIRNQIMLKRELPYFIPETRKFHNIYSTYAQLQDKLPDGSFFHMYYFDFSGFTKEKDYSYGTSALITQKFLWSFDPWSGYTVLIRYNPETKESYVMRQYQEIDFYSVFNYFLMNVLADCQYRKIPTTLESIFPDGKSSTLSQCVNLDSPYFYLIAEKDEEDHHFNLCPEVTITIDENRDPLFILDADIISQYGLPMYKDYCSTDPKELALMFCLIKTRNQELTQISLEKISRPIKLND